VINDSLLKLLNKKGFRFRKPFLTLCSYRPIPPTSPSAPPSPPFPNSLSENVISDYICTILNIISHCSIATFRFRTSRNDSFLRLFSHSQTDCKGGFKGDYFNDINADRIVFCPYKSITSPTPPSAPVM